MKKYIAVLAGDGIGPEVMMEACKVLDKIAARFGHTFKFAEALIGGAAYDEYGQHLPLETIGICEQSDAILFGSVGGPVTEQHKKKWQGAEKNAILGLRGHFDLFANLRPTYLYKPLVDLSVLKSTLVEEGIDLMIVRELTGGIYFGKHETIEHNGQKSARDVLEYTNWQIERIAHTAFQVATKRSKKVTLVDKANVLDSSVLWREVVRKVAEDYPEVTLEYMYVDNAAMQLIKNPRTFDTILTENLFGDILSDLASVLAGSLGLLPSASLNAKGFGLYEPIGGSAPDIAGKNIANPIAQIISAVMMLKYSFGMIEEGQAIENAVIKTLEEGFRTADIYQDGMKKISTSEMGEEICCRIRA